MRTLVLNSAARKVIRECQLIIHDWDKSIKKISIDKKTTVLIILNNNAKTTIFALGRISISTLP